MIRFLSLVALASCVWLVVGCASSGKSGPETAGATTQAAQRVVFYEQKSKVQSIVYVIEASAANAENFEPLKNELVRSVNGMIPGQKFGVVMVGDKVESVWPELIQAKPETKKEFAEKVSLMKAGGDVAGKLEPWKEAIEKAFGMKPEKIYILAAGPIDPGVADVVRKLNSEKKVQVNTLGYLPYDADRDAQLKEIAKENGGMFKAVTANDFNR